MFQNTATPYFYSGTSGLVLPINKSHYPPDFKNKSQLQYYSSIFNSVEINSLFYKLPKNSTINKWANNVPKEFRFTFKVPKLITHSGKLDYILKDLTDFIEVVEHVGEKKGCLLLQFPPSLTIEKIESLKNLLEQLMSVSVTNSWKIAIEFRNSSWNEPQVHQLLSSFNASMVLHDMNKDYTVWDQAHGDFVYLRFHGPEPRYRGNYSDEFLNQRADSIKKWINEEKTVYAYFNNTLGSAYNNLMTLNRLVKL